MINKRCEGMFGHSKIRSPLLNAICNTITYHVYVCYKELWSIYVLVLHIIWKHCLWFLQVAGSELICFIIYMYISHGDI